MKVTDKVYALDCTKGAYSYAVLEADGVTLVDTGFPGHGDEIVAEVKTLTDKQIKRILLTHSDFDHMGSAAEIQKQTGCPVYISKGELPYATWEIPRPPLKDQKCKEANVQVPDMTVYEGDRIGDFLLISTPGHTPDHIAILFENVMFSGDLVVEKEGGDFSGPNPMFTADMEMSMASLKKLKAYDFEWMCPVHGHHVKKEQVFDNLN